MRLRYAAALICVPITMSVAPSVRADDQPPVKANGSVWYGWQTLSVDALAIGALAVTPPIWGQASPELVPISAALFLSAPVMHALNHRWSAFGTSLAMRALIGFTSAIVGLGIGAGSCNGCDLLTFGASSQGLYLGLLIGMTVSATIDATAIGWAPRFKLRTEEAWTVVPRVDAHGGSLSFVETF